MRKLISFLSIIIALSMFAGCSGGQSGEQPSNTETGGNTPAAQNQGFELTGEIGGEINISCYESYTYKEFLEQAAIKFEAKYPGTKINVNTFSQMPEVKTMDTDEGTVAVATIEDDLQGMNDYIFKAGNDLMAGTGADIYALDILPYEKYAEAGYLEDFSKYLDSDPDFNMDEYRKSIFDALTKDGEIYRLPLSYGFEFITYNREVLTDNQVNKLFGGKSALTISEIIDKGLEMLKEYNGNNEEQAKLISYGKEQLFSILVNERFKEFIDVESGNVNLDDGKFAELLNKIEQIGESGVLNDVDYTNFTMEYFEELMNAKFLMKSEGSYMLMNYAANNLDLDMEEYRGFVNENDRIAGLKGNTSGEAIATISESFGLNSNSQNKRTAWEFLKFLLSEDIQSSSSLSSIPLNLEAVKKQTELEITGELYMPVEDRKYPELTNEQSLIFDEYLKLLEDYSADINTVQSIDMEIFTMISEETNYFWKGEKTADEIASTLQSKIKLYINE